MNYTAIARQYIANGFSVIPLQLDGSKSPAGSWKPFQGRSATDHELQQWFGNGEPCGLGIVAGGISGNLQILDFDLEAEKQFQRFWADAEKQLPGITNKILVVATPRPGRQVWFRKTSQPAGNQILAYSEPIPTEEYDADGQPISKPQVLIETRGTGGYAVAAGSHPSVHRTGKPYQLMHGRLETLPQLTDQEAENLLNICRSYNRFQPHHDGWKQGLPYAGEPRPGDIFNQLVDIRELLPKYHWQLHHKGHDGTEHWTRPGRKLPMAVRQHSDMCGPTMISHGCTCSRRALRRWNRTALMMLFRCTRWWSTMGISAQPRRLPGNRTRPRFRQPRCSITTTENRMRKIGRNGRSYRVQRCTALLARSSPHWRH